MKHAGIGMTSQRTRARLIERLFEQGIKDVRVLEVIREFDLRLFGIAEFGLTELQKIGNI